MIPQAGRPAQSTIRDDPLHRGRNGLSMVPINPPAPQLQPAQAFPSHLTRTPLAPAQYAYPVRLHHVSQELPENNGAGDFRSEAHGHIRLEHMLRRKTPNGTLVLGYDGTPVQWSTRPPPQKHVVLPMSAISTEIPSVANQYGDTFRTQPYQLPYGQSWYSLSSSQMQAVDSTPAMSDTGCTAFEDCTHLPPLSAVPQAMFDQVPINATPTHFMYNGVQVPTVLQPAYQPCLPPTASNDGGHYGTFWSDGRYELYQPAALRVVGCTSISHRSPAFPSIFEPQPFRHSSLENQQEVGEFLEYRYRNEGLGSTATLGQHSRTSPTDNDLRDVAWNEPGTVNPFTISTTQNAQFKEKVLIWAHSAYVDLLAFLGQSKQLGRAKRTHGLSRSHSQTNIYPKPPRQPCSSFVGNCKPESTYYVHDTKSVEAGRPFLAMNSGSNMFSRGVDTRSGSMSSRRRSHPLANDLEEKRSLNRPDTVRRPSHSSLRRNSGCNISPIDRSALDNAGAALEMLKNLCQESGWKWIDGMLLGGCLAYGLKDLQMALDWYTKIVLIDPGHVEAISNLGATLLSLNRRQEAERYWLQAVKLRPSYFDAVEHLIGLLCIDHRGKEAISIIEYVESCLRVSSNRDEDPEQMSETSSDGSLSSCDSTYVPSDHGTFDFEGDRRHRALNSTKIDHVCQDDKCLPINGQFSEVKDNITKRPGFGSSGYRIPGSENGRMLTLIHAKGNMLYALGDVGGASQAFEDAVLISAGRRIHGIQGLIRKILHVLGVDAGAFADRDPSVAEPLLLLPPDKALRTATLVFSKNGQLPGLAHVAEGSLRNASVSTTSNSLLSLAKIFQDSMSSSTRSPSRTSRPSGVGDILALYYLSLSLQPSPSTANNVGILLASVQQSATQRTSHWRESSLPAIPGVVPGSGIALALAYYNYGLNLDSRHAHLYTNLGSLLKDIGQLAAAVKMYEQAVACDPSFDIALANLANAVKDQGRISNAIEYYKRAVASSPDFAEAVCGLSSALNSVCDWTGRGGVILEATKYDRWHVDDDGMLCDAKVSGATAGWMNRVVEIVGRQLDDGANWGRGVLEEHVLKSILHQLEIADTGDRWSTEKSLSMQCTLRSWVGKSWEGARLVRFLERAVKRAMHRWYKDKFVARRLLPMSSYCRPRLPNTLPIPGAPTVLPFHTFTCPLTAKEIRMISQRNAMRISCSTLRAPWLPSTVYPPPPPPNPNLNIGYVSSDFNNHPLAHLMQSVFGLHNRLKAKAFCYATTASDRSIHRQQIEREAPVFHDTSTWSSERLVQQIIQDEIHILVNLNGYTRGARNEVFAARPAPIQMSFMGFAGTLGAEWCDYLLADGIAVPPETLRPWRRNVELEDQICENAVDEDDQWVYSENIIFCRDTFFCCDHRQSSPDPQLPWEEEQYRRWKMRKELFPSLSDDAIILGNFNQLYKIDPTTFRTWLRILSKVPNAILWLLRFPDLGESNLKRTARRWAGDDVASRIWFMDVAPKDQHISRARICDLFLDTPECNAHTTAADILWSSTPLLTLPRYKYKMCSRMAASILKGALPRSLEGSIAASELIAQNDDQYEDFAVKLAGGLQYSRNGVGSGRLNDLRKLLYENRWNSALFDTKRWVSDLELAYEEAWRRWVAGIGGDIYL